MEVKERALIPLCNLQRIVKSLFSISVTEKNIRIIFVENCK